jgi:hypothetical protein
MINFNLFLGLWLNNGIDQVQVTLDVINFIFKKIDDIYKDLIDT